MQKRLSFALLCLTLLLIPATAGAQNQVTLSSMEIDLWPEYDRPTVLVIYHATLSQEVSLPATLTFRIPAAAGEPNAVAIQQVDGALLTVNYDRQVSGEWALITFTATTPQVQLEYYDPRLEKQDLQRKFEYQWPGDYAVASMRVQVQQPKGASDMRISPSMGSGSQAPDGLIYYTTQVGAIAADDTFRITLDYNKASDELSAGGLNLEPSAPISQDTAGRLDIMGLLPWALGILGVILIAGGGLWYWQSNREENLSKRQRRRKTLPAPVEEAAPEDAVYCHQCGKRAAPGDRFCRSCGTRLRI